MWCMTSFDASITGGELESNVQLPNVRFVTGVAGIWGSPVFGHPQPHITSVMGIGVPITLSKIWTLWVP